MQKEEEIADGEENTVKITIYFNWLVLFFTFFFRIASESDEIYPYVDDKARVQESKRILESIRRDLLQAAKQLEKTNAEFEEVTKQLGDKSRCFWSCFIVYSRCAIFFAKF